MQQSEPSQLSAWVDAHCVADAAMADAYESLTPQERAVLKLCIARLYRIWGESPRDARRAVRFEADFCLHQKEHPVASALFICDAAYAHPAALLAAIMPALLAGVTSIYPCFVSNEDAQPYPPLLAAMELAGVQQCFRTSLPACHALFRILFEAGEQGRLVLLGEEFFGGDLLLAAHKQGVPCRSFIRPPLYIADASGTVLESRFRQGRPHAAAPDPASLAGTAPFLRLDAGHEDVWVWPDLTPSWFRVRHLTLTS